ncbi:unnamed protein product, partial [Brassica rapa]
RHRRLLLFSCLFVFPLLHRCSLHPPCLVVALLLEARRERGMPGGWSLDAERVWFRLVRSDFRVW